MSQNRWPTTEAISAVNTQSLAVLPPAEGVWTKVRRNGALLAGGALLVLVIVWAGIVPLVLSLDPYAVDPARRLAPPGGDHLLGTDGVVRARRSSSAPVSPC
jgi:peptide/nickel transport system permease protein